jgi:secreted PhoX family phosphatase
VINMTGSLPRRGLLRAGAVGFGIAVGGSLDAIAGHATPRPRAGYGPLVPDPDGLLALPAGFKYRIVAQAGKTRLESGQVTPSDMDGMACFPAKHGWTLVTNHEIDGIEEHGVPALPGLVYDPAAAGGTTTIEVDRRGRRIREYVSVAGTHNNCAGGVTPWGTWLSCEESEARAGRGFTKDHGYVFEVDPHDEDANRDPVPLRFLGRYAHEAVAVDPATHTIYLTEDAAAPQGLYYRWTPPKRFTGGKGALRHLARGPHGATAGTLEAMKCATLDGAHVADLAQAREEGTRYRVTWVDVPDRDGRRVPVRTQFSTDEITRSRKLEGQWWGDGGVYFVASYARKDDGSVRDHDGQVWFYDPAECTITLRTIFGVSPEAAAFDGPDNITLSPHGGLMMAENGLGLSHVVGLTADGVAYPMARNEVNGSEFAGPVFSADGEVLFANIQDPGYVFAITGPWGRPAT